MKRCFARSALVDALCNLVGGLFYREFTKAFAFEGETTLSVVHTPYFVLGMVFMLALLALEASLGFATTATKKWCLLYHLGLNVTVAMLVARGVTQVLGCELSRAFDASMSGLAGVGHILLSVALIGLSSQVLGATKKE